MASKRPTEYHLSLKTTRSPRLGLRSKKSLDPDKVLDGNGDKFEKAEVLGKKKIGSNFVDLNLASDPPKKEHF